MARPFQSSSWCPGGPVAHRRGADELGALEAVVQVVERQEQVLRAGLCVGRQPLVLCAPQRLERLLRRHVDEVDRRLRRLGEPDHAVRRLALEDRIPRKAVPDRVGHALSDELGRDHVDDRPVLGVHQDEAAVLRRPLQRLEDGRVVAVEDARIRGEELEAGHALVDEGVHLRHEVVPHVRDDHVERIVDADVAVGLLVPLLEALAEGPTTRLHGEVDDRRRPAEGRGPRAGLERVLGERAAEGQLHVGVRIDAARDHPPPGRVDDAVGGDAGALQVRADLHDRLAVDEDVTGRGGVGVDDGAALDQRAHRSLLGTGM